MRTAILSIASTFTSPAQSTGNLLDYYSLTVEWDNGEKEYTTCTVAYANSFAFLGSRLSEEYIDKRFAARTKDVYSIGYGIYAALANKPTTCNTP